MKHTLRKAAILAATLLSLLAPQWVVADGHGHAGGHEATAPRADKADTGPVFVRKGYAIRGYDTVAYFTESQPVKGDKQFSYEWRGATWLFSSQENLDKFKADPVAYAPQYGGYCAFGIVGAERLIKTSPKAWHIHEGKLYLNLNRGVQKRWEGEKAYFIEEGDKLWPQFRDAEKS